MEGCGAGADRFQGRARQIPVGTDRDPGKADHRPESADRYRTAGPLPETAEGVPVLRYPRVVAGAPRTNDLGKVAPVSQEPDHRSFAALKAHPAHGTRLREH